MCPLKQLCAPAMAAVAVRIIDGVLRFFKIHTIAFMDGFLMTNCQNFCRCGNAEIEDILQSQTKVDHPEMRCNTFACVVVMHAYRCTLEGSIPKLAAACVMFFPINRKYSPIIIDITNFHFHNY